MRAQAEANGNTIRRDRTRHRHAHAEVWEGRMPEGLNPSFFNSSTPLVGSRLGDPKPAKAPGSLIYHGQAERKSTRSLKGSTSKDFSVEQRLQLRSLEPAALASRIGSRPWRFTKAMIPSELWWVETESWAWSCH